MDFQDPVTIEEISTTLAPHISEVLEPSAVALTNLCHPEVATASSIVYATTERHLETALNSQAGCLIANQKLKTLLADRTWGRPVLLSALPELLVREILQRFSVVQTPFHEHPAEHIHPSAQVDPSATIGTGVTIGPHAYVGPQCQVGDFCYIGTNAVVSRNCQLGDHTTVHPLVYLGHGTVLGKKCEIMPQATIGSEGFGYSQNQHFQHFRIPHGGSVIIGDDVHIGANCCIDRGSLQDTTIGSGTKIDNLVHLAHNVSVGENCLITANVTVAGSTSLGSRMMIGGSTSIDGHLKIGDDVHFQAISGVTKPLTKPGVYGGFPAHPTMTYKRNQATYMKLAELRKTVEGLVKAQEKKDT